MRMWLVDSKIMCRQHLLGEHRELHAFVGTIKKKRNVFGYIRNNLLDVELLSTRHEELVMEMNRRLYNHHSPLPKIEEELIEDIKFYKVDREKAKSDLLSRCPECRKREQDFTDKEK